MNEFVFLYRRPATALDAAADAGVDGEVAGVVQGHGGRAATSPTTGNRSSPRAGRVVRDKKGSFSDGPYAETKDIVIGYSVIAAKDLDEAVALANGPSDLRSRAGVIEIRPILKM